jgi:hypothetical protein
MIVLSDNLNQLNDTFKEYSGLFRKGRLEALRKAAHNFSVYVPRNLKRIAPIKGNITSAALSRMKSKAGGTIVSQRAKNLVMMRWGMASSSTGRLMALGTSWSKKHQNYGLTKKQSKILAHLSKGATGERGAYQALFVEQELKLRERHRVFTAASTLFNKAGEIRQSYSYRGKVKLGSASEIGKDSGFSLDSDDSFEFRWGSNINKDSSMAAGVLKNVSKATTAFSDGILELRKDMIAYINRKHIEASRSAARKVSSISFTKSAGVSGSLWRSRI